MLGLAAGICPEIASGQDAASSNISSPLTSSSETAPSGTTSSLTGTSDLSAPTTPSGGGAAAAAVGQPSGTGTFSRPPVVIDVSLNSGYDTNVDNAHNGGQGSGFTSGNIALTYSFGEPRLQIALNAAAGGTYYYSTVSTQNYDINLTGGFSLNYKASPRLTLASNVLLAYLTEPSFNYGVGLATRNGNYFYTADSFSADYSWTQRFSTRSQYNLAVIKYEDSTVGAFQDRVENTFGNQFRLQLAPTSTLVAEYRFEVINYDVETSLDSTTHFVLAGFDQTFSPQLTATFRGGSEFRSYTNDGTDSGPYFEGNVNYIVGKRTKIIWNSFYGIGEPNVTSPQSRTVFHTGLEGDVNLTARIGTSLTFYYEHSDYNSFISGAVTIPGFTQDTYDFGISLRYAISRMLRLQAGYHHTEVTDDPGLGYSRESIFGGVNVTF
jgi:hypothetical protein